MTWAFPRLSRRAFMKTTGLGAASFSLLKPLNSIGDAGHPETDRTDHTHSICNFCSSLCNLRVTTRTVNGVKRIVKLDGNPHSTLNRGKLCARGQSGLRQTYDTDRLKNPLIRVEGSQRGEWAFRTATWDEAWKYIEQKNKEKAIQPWEWTMVGGWTSCVFYMNWAVPFALANQVPNIVASPMQHCVTTGHLGTDLVTGNFNIHDEVLPDYDNAKYILFIANNASIGAVSTCRMVRFATGKKRGAKVVALDSRLSETAAKADEWIAIRPGTDLDFLLAMMKVMMEEGLYDALFLKRHSNMPFLAWRDKDGELHLALDANGRPRVVTEGSRQIHTLPAYANANGVDVSGANIDPSLTAPAGLTVDGHPVMTVFQAQLQELAAYTPEWAAKTTGIPAETIGRIAREFGSTRPAIVDPGWHGARYGNMMMLRRVQAMIQALTGGIDKEGGWIMAGEFHHKAARMIEAQKEHRDAGPPLSSLAGMHFARMVINTFSNGANFSHGKPGWAWAYSAQQKEAGKPFVALPVMADVGLLESVRGEVSWKGKPYKTRAFLINAANPVRHYYPDTRWKDILGHKDVDLVIAIDVLPSDTCAWADVILPNTSYLERNEPVLYGNGVNHDLALTTRYAAIDPLYDTEETPDMLLKLTKILSGNEQGFLSWVEKLTGLPAADVKAAYARKNQPGAKGAFSAACREVSFAQAAKRLKTTPAEIDLALRSNGILMEEKREELLKHTAMPRVLPLPTDSGRIEFFAPLFHALRAGGAKQPNFGVLATHIASQCRGMTPVTTPLASDEFYFTYGKSPTVSYASTNSNNPVLSAINNFKKEIYTGIWIHPDRAGPLGIQSGDRIRLTNTRSGQQADGTAYVTRQVHREVLFLYSSFGAENKALTRAHGFGTATSKLIPYEVEPVVAGFRSQEFTLKVTKLDEKVAAIDGSSLAASTTGQPPHPIPLPGGEGELVGFATELIGGVA